MTRRRYGGGRYILNVSLKVNDIAPFDIPITKDQFNYLTDDANDDKAKKKMCFDIIERKKTHDVQDDYYYMFNISEVVNISRVVNNTVFVYAFCSIYSEYDSADEFSKALKPTSRKTKTQKSISSGGRTRRRRRLAHRN